MPAQAPSGPCAMCGKYVDTVATDDWSHCHRSKLTCGPCSDKHYGFRWGDACIKTERDKEIYDEIRAEKIRDKYGDLEI